MGYEAKSNPISRAVKSKATPKEIEHLQMVKVMASKIRRQDDWDAVLREVEPSLRDQVRGLLAAFVNFTPGGHA